MGEEFSYADEAKRANERQKLKDKDPHQNTAKGPEEVPATPEAKPNGLDPQSDRVPCGVEQNVVNGIVQSGQEPDQKPSGEVPEKISTPKPPCPDSAIQAENKGTQENLASQAKKTVTFVADQSGKDSVPPKASEDFTAEGQNTVAKPSDKAELSPDPVKLKAEDSGTDARNSTQKNQDPPAQPPESAEEKKATQIPAGQNKETIPLKAEIPDSSLDSPDKSKTEGEVPGKAKQGPVSSQKKEKIVIDLTTGPKGSHQKGKAPDPPKPSGQGQGVKASAGQAAKGQEAPKSPPGQTVKGSGVKGQGLKNQGQMPNSSEAKGQDQASQGLNQKQGQAAKGAGVKNQNQTPKGRGRGKSQLTKDPGEKSQAEKPKSEEADKGPKQGPRGKNQQPKDPGQQGEGSGKTTGSAEPKSQDAPDAKPKTPAQPTTRQNPFKLADQKAKAQESARKSLDPKAKGPAKPAWAQKQKPADPSTAAKGQKGFVSFWHENTQQNCTRQFLRF